MRLIVVLASLIAATAAGAQGSYYAERGHWLVASTQSACRAINRPPEDFNYSPYNALSIVARADNTLGVEVFFWPGALDPARQYRLQLNFRATGSTTLDATPASGDFMLISVRNVDLWKLLQNATAVDVSIEGEQRLAISFGLDDMAWILRSLQTCLGRLPKP